MFVKSIYSKHPNEDEIIKFIDAGLDTVFLNLNGTNSKEEVRYLFDKYCEQIDLIPLVFYIQGDKRLQEYEHFSNNNHLICPTNVNMIRKLIEFPKDLYLDGLCNSIAINFKSYAKDEDYHNHLIESRCECERCKDMTEKQQRMTNITMIQETLEGIPLYSLSNANPYLLEISDYWINEYTYNKWDPYKYIYQQLDNITVKSISVIRFHNVKRVMKSVMTDGYCLYPNDDIDYKKLKELNKKVDRYRDNWWFKFKKGK